MGGERPVQCDWDRWRKSLLTGPFQIKGFLVTWQRVPLDWKVWLFLFFIQCVTLDFSLWKAIAVPSGPMIYLSGYNYSDCRWFSSPTIYSTVSHTVFEIIKCHCQFARSTIAEKAKLWACLRESFYTELVEVWKSTSMNGIYSWAGVLTYTKKRKLASH